MKHRTSFHLVDWSYLINQFPHNLYRSDTCKWWNPNEIETLVELIKQDTRQVEISASLPNRNWRVIRIKAYEILGERKSHISPKSIRDKETYGDYLQRVETDGAEANRTSGKRWTEDELDSLAQE